MNVDSRSHVPTYIVGGGLAGLTAAAILSAAGQPVVVLEAGRTLGGRARTRWVDGFGINVGPHALYVSGSGARILKELGVDLSGGMPRLWRYDVLIDHEPVSIASFTARRTRSRRSMLRVGMGRWPRTPPGTSAAEVLHAMPLDDVGRAGAEMLCRIATYSGDLSLLDAAVAQRQLRMALYPGVRYLHGGWEQLVAGLRRVIEANGGEIRTGTAVSAVHHDVAVRSIELRNGEEIPAERVVVALPDASRATRLLDGPGADRLSDATCDHTPVHMAHLDVALRSGGRRLRSLIDPAQRTYVSVPSDVSRVAPGDGVMVHAGRYLLDSELRGDYRPALEAALDVMEPDWRDHVVDARYTPSSMVAGDHARPLREGTRRVGVDGAGVAGLALAGDWVAADPSFDEGILADASITSAATAAQRLLHRGVSPAHTRGATMVR
ncbi:MAG: phytoene desaturase family protein [Microthrixaceae bacterium]